MKKKIEELEIRMMYQEDLIKDLNQVVIDSSFSIKKLQAEINLLKKKIEDLSEEQGPFKDNEKPPHY